MMSISEEEFHSLYWPKLESAIQLIVQQKPGEFIPISYEEMYSAVYKCVCQQYSEKLYGKLMTIMVRILETVRSDLESQPVELYLKRFSYIMSQYFQSVEGIAAIFNYMNRFYVKPKRCTELKVELLAMFSSVITENTRLFEILSQSGSQPFIADPDLLMSIVQRLYSLRPDCAERVPDLFARFIPNISAHCFTLDEEICQAQLLQTMLSNNDEFSREHNSKKRSVDCLDDNMEGHLRKV